MSLTKSTGNFIDPLSPVYDLPYDPKGGSGILKAEIWITFLGLNTTAECYLPYQWSETVNGIELEIEKPSIIHNASALEEDIHNSLLAQGIKFDTINYISK